MKVFLGGTCNESTWREELIALLTTNVDWYNPVVPDWTPECMEEEVRQRQICDTSLFIITPKMTGTFAIAEVVDDSNKRPYKTVMCILAKDGNHTFTSGQLKSLKQVAHMVEKNGSDTYDSLQSVAKALNNRALAFKRGRQCN